MAADGGNSFIKSTVAHPHWGIKFIKSSVSGLQVWPEPGWACLGMGWGWNGLLLRARDARFNNLKFSVPRHGCGGWGVEGGGLWGGLG